MIDLTLRGLLGKVLPKRARTAAPSVLLSVPAKQALRNALRHDKLARIGLLMIAFFVFLGIFGPLLAPYSPQEIHRDAEGGILRLSPPSLEHPFGTTNMGRDVFSATIIGTRTALIVGSLTAVLVTVIGTTLGLMAGYHGGWLDSLVMRTVDILYGIPLMPSVLVLVVLLGPSMWNLIIVISLISWRQTARIVRSQVLSLRERPFVKAAKTAGASNRRIIFVHLLPNVIPLALLEMTLAIVYVIITEANISFVGFGDPQSISWGSVLHMAFLTGSGRTAWWWVIPPGLAIILLCTGIYFASRLFEGVVNPRLQQQQLGA